MQRVLNEETLHGFEELEVPFGALWSCLFFQVCDLHVTR
jgi:hypothetical protein